MIKLRGIDHLVLRVRDIDRTIAFYTEVIGAKLEWRRPELGDLCHLRVGPTTLIDLVPVGSDLGKKGGAAPGKDGRNVDHFCLQVESLDVEPTIAYLRSRGAEVGEVMSRYGAEGRSVSIYVLDPDGNTVELKGPPNEAPKYPGEPNPAKISA